MNAWQTLLFVQMAQGRYLRLGRPATDLDWWTLLTMAQGWTVVVG